jgi:hypothetical protein
VIGSDPDIDATDLTVADDATIGDELQVDDNATISGNFIVGGTSTFNDDAYIVDGDSDDDQYIIFERGDGASNPYIRYIQSTYGIEAYTGYKDAVPATGYFWVTIGDTRVMSMGQVTTEFNSAMSASGAVVSQTSLAAPLYYVNSVGEITAGSGAPSSPTLGDVYIRTDVQSDDDSFPLYAVVSTAGGYAWKGVVHENFTLATGEGLAGGGKLSNDRTFDLDSSYWDFDTDGNLEVVNGLDVGGYLDLAEISPPASPAANQLRYFSEDVKGFSFPSIVDAGGMTRKLLRDSVFVGKNETGSTIAASRIVYAAGSVDDVPSIALAKADAAATMPAIGVTLESIADGAFGRIMQVGLLEDVNTLAYSAGDVLYVSAATAGVPTATAPVYPNIAQEIGTILVDSATVGAIQIVARSILAILHGASHTDGVDDIQDATTGQKGLMTAAYATSVEANTAAVGAIDADSNGLIYGEIYYHGSGFNTVLAAQDTDYQILGFDTDGLSNNTTPAHGEDHITVANAGMYLVSYSVSARSAASNQYEFKVKYNNGATEVANSHTHRDTTVGGKLGVAASTCIADLPASATVELWVFRTDGAAVSKTITIEAVNLVVTKIGAT